MRLAFTVFILLLALSGFAQRLAYPATFKTPVSDTLFSIILEDDYRWFEDESVEGTNEWIEMQNTLCRKYLKKASLKANSYNAIDKYSFVKCENPQKIGDYYFTHGYYNDFSVPALFYKQGLRAEYSVLVDPNFISRNDIINLKGYNVSKDSKLLAYQYSRNGSDWGEIEIVNLKNAVTKSDRLVNVKFSGMAWRGNGFYYSKYPTTRLGKTIGQEIYYHQVGTAQSEDELIFKRSKNPEATFTCTTTDDERFLIIKEIDEVKSRINIFYTDFNEAIPSLKPLITRLHTSDNISILDNIGDTLIATTFKDVNNGMLIKIDTKNPRVWKSFIPEYASALLLETVILENCLINIYQSNRKQQIVFYNYQGEVLHAIDLPFGFSVNGFNGEQSDKEILFSYEGYTQPKIVYKLNVETYEMSPLSATIVNFDHTKYETKAIEYYSFDSTLVSLYMIYKQGTNLSTPNPLLLEAYGGFGSIATPGFRPGLIHFLNKGGVFAYANIRGGGDKGKEWAFSGRGFEKNNSFNDFIAASEYLINNNFTSANQLGITGGSNGGLVVAVAMTRRPDLYKAVIPVVAPFDMVRFDRFTIGHLHHDEYGSSSDSLGLLNLLSYSPLHNIDASINYPATLIMTSDNDDRVPPLHSYKFCAKMQSSSAQLNPILLRVAEDAGHYGAGSSYRSSLKEEADKYNFLIYQLMEVQ